MPFDAATLANLEDALSEGFKYHDQLDVFAMRSGITKAHIDGARRDADTRAKQSQRKDYHRAPKRFVVQALLRSLSDLGAEGDRLVAALITGITRAPLEEATPNARAAIERLKAQIDVDRREKERVRIEREKAEQEKERENERQRHEAYLKHQREREALKARFLGLLSEGNAQSRGYLFETFLNELFSFEGLAPKASFKIVGEQIDGSFAWRGRTYLVEAKWVKDPIAGAEFGAFAYKLEGKTADTRGLYISVNGYSPQAIQGLEGKGALKFVCIDGAHIVRALSVGQTLAGILEIVWRHADETGAAYLATSNFRHS